MTTPVQRLLLALTLPWISLVTTSCASDVRTTGSFELADGTTVVVDGDGSVVIADATHTLFRSRGAGLATVANDTSFRTLLGGYDFSDTEVARATLDQVTGITSSDAGVRITLGSSAVAEVRGVLDVSVVVAGETTRARLVVTGLPGSTTTELRLACDEQATFLGFGAQYNATDQRGESFDLFVEEQGIGRRGGLPLMGNAHSTYFPVPSWLDARGFGVALETEARVSVDVCAADDTVMRVSVHSAQPADLLLFHGPTARDVIREVGDHFGRSQAPPAWGFGPWVGIQGGSAAVLAEADALDAAGVPFTALWAQDWTGKRSFVTGMEDVGVQYRWTADDTLYPDLAGLISTLHDRDIRFLGYANPFVQLNLPDHAQDMIDMGLVALDADGEPYTFTSPAVSPAVSPDFTNPATGEYIKGYLRAMITTYGMDGWMADFGEWAPVDAVLSTGRDPMLAHNTFPTEWHALSREVFEELRPDGDWAVFTRSGWAGEQGTAQIVWIGDQEADFLPSDGLPTVVPALINLGLTGLPFVTHDIAGFSGGPSTKELWLRWCELGAFTPVMRTHEGLKRSLNWNWDGDAETTAHFRRFARIHELLLPELMTLAAEAASSSLPMLRHLTLVFPEDEGSRTVADQFMLGDTLLVAPVVTEGAVTQSVYLPPGSWFHVWTGDTYTGGQRVTVDAPIGQPPVFSLGTDRADIRAVSDQLTP
ncbi:MAG: glycoside hydrolase family 31 protein [Polyangiales bacterium]|nr:hypothetical protein [Myxococcales bacterium]MCB9660269.1 hypothetical protein [Sandaracinaceae bacterium]